MLSIASKCYPLQSQSAGPSLVTAAMFLHRGGVPCLLARWTSNPMAVPYVEIAPSVLMPMLSFGFSNRSLFVSLGGRSLDTAYDYGDANQLETGTAVSGSGLPRSELFVTTKIPCCPSHFM
jgi:hypothetical protein